MSLKFLLLLALVLPAGTSWGCPVISGIYRSESKNKLVLVIKSNPKQSPMAYDFTLTGPNGYEFAWKTIVDNTTRQIDIGPRFKNVVAVSNCFWDGVHQIMAGDYYSKKGIYNFTQEWRFFNSSDGQLIWEASYKDNKQDTPSFKVYTFQKVSEI